MKFDDFWIVVAALCGLSIFLASRTPRSRARRAFARANYVPIGEIKDGQWAKVEGIVGAVAPAITSPLGDEACIRFRLEVKRVGEENDSLSLTKQDGVSFSMTDETGAVVVEGPCLVTFDLWQAWSALEEEDLGFLEEEGVGGARMPSLFGGTAFQFREWLLQPGDRISVLGLAFIEPDPASPSPGSPKIRSAVVRN